MIKIPGLFVILLMVSYACKDSVYEPYNNNFSDYFPNSEGNYYYYNVSVLDTNGTIIQSGTRKSYYKGDTTIFTVKNQIKVDSFQLSSTQSVANNYFRKDSYGVYNFVDVDTNGFYILLPDSLRDNISFPLQFPILINLLEVNKTWHLFDAWTDIPQFQVFNVEAEVVSSDTFTIPLPSKTRFTQAYNIKYNAKLTTGFNRPPILFEVHVWFAKGIGPVKWEGDSDLINFFAGAEIYPMNTIVKEDLYSFKVY